MRTTYVAQASLPFIMRIWKLAWQNIKAFGFATMVSHELLEQLHKLDRVDKLQIIQLLATELANEENNLIKSGASYPVWSPYDAVEAANIMLGVLK